MPSLAFGLRSRRCQARSSPTFSAGNRQPPTSVDICLLFSELYVITADVEIETLVIEVISRDQWFQHMRFTPPYTQIDGVSHSKSFHDFTSIPMTQRVKKKKMCRTGDMLCSGCLL